MSTENCTRCGRLLLANAKLCTHCGFPVAFASEPSVSGSGWTAQSHEFAVRIRPAQVKALLTKGVNVDESQTGLLFESGRFEHELQPGRQTLETLPDRIRKYITGETASAVLIRRGLFPLTVLGVVLTPEGDEIRVAAELGVQLGDRNNFYVNLMQSTDLVSTGDLMRLLAPVARQALIGVVASCSSSELLNIHPELQQRLVDTVADALAPVCVRWGLRLGYVAPPSFSNRNLSEYQKERARIVSDLRDRNLQRAFDEAKDGIEIRRFQAARILAEAKLKQDIETAERTLEFSKLKAELSQRNELHTRNLQESLDAAMDGFAARRRERQFASEDVTSLRAHMLAVLETQRERELLTLQFEIRKAGLLQQQELDDLTRSQRLRVEQEDLAADIRRLEATQIGEIDRWRRKQNADQASRIDEAQTQSVIAEISGDARRKQMRADQQLEIEHRVAGHQQTITEEQDRIQLEAARLKSQSAVQAEHLARLQTLELTEQQAAAAAEKARHELTEAAKDREHGRKMAEMQLLKDSPEMLQLLKMAELAVHSPAMTAAFGDVMKMAMARGLTVEQLELVAAQQSPQVADALKEKFRSQAAAGSGSLQTQQESLERIVTELRNQQQLTQQQTTDFLDRLERVSVNGQQMLRDVSVVAGARVESRKDDRKTQEAISDLLKQVHELKQRLEVRTDVSKPE